MTRYTSWAQVPLIMDLSIAAVILGRTTESLKRLSQKGEFPAFKNGERFWSITKEDLQQYIEGQKVRKPPQQTVQGVRKIG